MTYTISTTLLFAAVLGAVTAAPAAAQTFPAPGNIRVCYGQDNCTSSSNGLVHQTTSLQSALNYLHSHPRSPSKKAYILLSPGFYRNLDFAAAESALQTMSQKDWRTDNGQGSCASEDAYLGFVLRNQDNVIIRGTSGDPSDVMIWGKVPDYAVNAFPAARPIFHGFAVDRGSSVQIRDLSLISDGGYTENGAGDASLYIKSAIVTLTNTVILGNKNPSNCLRGDADHDQEGVLVDGGIVTIYDSAIGGNIHTGVMVLDGGMTHIERTLVRGNGWDGGQFQSNGHGHGVTSFYHSTATTCFDGNTHIEVYDSEIRSNTGHGVYLRGHFLWSSQDIQYSDLVSNRGYGVRIDGGWGNGVTTLVSAFIYATLNVISGNVLGSVSSAQVVYQGSSGIVASPNNGAGHGTPRDFSPIWNQLISVHQFMGSQVPTDCP